MRKIKQIKKDWFGAVSWMKKGGMIRRKTWPIDDFLFIKNGELFCDGGFNYLGYLKSTKGNWYCLPMLNNKPLKDGEA